MLTFCLELADYVEREFLTHIVKQRTAGSVYMDGSHNPRPNELHATKVMKQVILHKIQQKFNV